MRNYNNGPDMAAKKPWNKPRIKAALSIRETLGGNAAGGDAEGKQVKGGGKGGGS